MVFSKKKKLGLMASLLYGWNKLMIKKAIWYLINWTVAAAVSMKSRVHPFGKIYHENIIFIV